MFFFAGNFFVDRPAPTDIKNAWASKPGTAALLAAFWETLGPLRFFFGVRIANPPNNPATESPSNSTRDPKLQARLSSLLLRPNLAELSIRYRPVSFERQE